MCALNKMKGMKFSMETEEEKKKTLNDYMASSLETLKHLKKKRKKRIFLISICIILLIFFFFYGPFSWMFVTKKHLRFYEVKINNHELSVSEKINNTTIIPIFLVIPNGNSEFFYSKNNEKDNVITDESYLLSIKSYTCFLKSDKDKVPISCNSNTESKYENYDTSYERMQILQYNYDDKYTYSLGNEDLSRSYYIGENSMITRAYKEYSIIYEGKFIEDLTPYISKENVYLIKVDFKYNGTEGTISFGVVNDGENIIAL